MPRTTYLSATDKMILDSAFNEPYDVVGTQCLLYPNEQVCFIKIPQSNHLDKFFMQNCHNGYQTPVTRKFVLQSIKAAIRLKMFYIEVCIDK